jgi:hypothetical protein
VSGRGRGGAAGSEGARPKAEHIGGCPTARSRSLLRGETVVVEAGRGSCGECGERLWAAEVGGRWNGSETTGDAETVWAAASE